MQSFMDKRVLSLLQDILGRNNLCAAPEDRIAYSFDSTMHTGIPDAVAFPASTPQVAEILKLANQEGFPVYPRGAGTGLSGGSLPRGGLALVLAGMDKILEIDAKNMLAVVEPGVVTGVLQSQVESLGLFYPPDPGSLNNCTIGGNIAECAGGPRALKYGVTRDYLLGLEVVTPNGQVINTGGKTVKNVSGYDLTRLVAGSEGTLGVVTRATLKLLPKPARVCTASAIFGTVEAASEAVAGIIGRGIIPTCLELMDDVTISCVENLLQLGLPRDAGAMLLIEVDGLGNEVDEAIATVRRVCLELGARRVEVAADQARREVLWKARRAVPAAIVQLKPAKISEDATVPRSMVPEMVRRLKDIARRHQVTMAIFGHAGDGNLHPNILADSRDAGEMARVEAAVQELFQTALALGGTLSGEHGIGIMKAPYLPLEVGPAGMETMRAIKRALDPNSILNPNKIIANAEGGLT